MKKDNRITVGAFLLVICCGVLPVVLPTLLRRQDPMHVHFAKRSTAEAIARVIHLDLDSKQPDPWLALSDRAKTEVLGLAGRRKTLEARKTKSGLYVFQLHGCICVVNTSPSQGAMRSWIMSDFNGGEGKGRRPEFAYSADGIRFDWMAHEPADTKLFPAEVKEELR